MHCACAKCCKGSLRFDPKIVVTFKLLANLVISFFQLLTKLVGHTISVGPAWGRLNVLAKNAITWSVLPNPMSSAKIPPNWWRFKKLSQSTPCCWYSRSVTESFKPCNETLGIALSVLFNSCKYSSSESSWSSTLIAVCFTSSGKYESGILNSSRVFTNSKRSLNSFNKLMADLLITPNWRPSG